MIEHWQQQQRGTSRLSWLDSRHSFSFADYYHPDKMGYSVLRVLNQDLVKAGGGFAEHPHRNMEIITYVTQGQLQHQDSMGNKSIINAGELQLMSAGSGVLHSEFNASQQHPVEFLQIWIEPNQRDTAPSYQQRQFALPANQFTTVVAPTNSGTPTLGVKQDMQLQFGRFAEPVEITQDLSPQRRYWLHLIEGELSLNGIAGFSGDSFAIDNTSQLNLFIARRSDVLLFDLP